MAITSIKTGSSFTNLQKYNDFLGPNAAYIPEYPATWLIQRTTLSADAATVSFTSIPQTYASLQIRILGKGINTGADVGLYFKVTVNSDTGSNYARHFLYGNGSATGAVGASSATPPIIGKIATNWTSTGTSTYGVGIIDIHDYASTTKNKTIRSISGVDANTAGGWIQLSSGLWQSTSAITRLDFETSSNDWMSGTTFALYGMKGSN